MEPWIQMLVTVFCAVLASSGFWALMQKVCDKKDSKTKLLLGIAHNAIMEKACTIWNVGIGLLKTSMRISTIICTSHILSLAAMVQLNG